MALKFKNFAVLLISKLMFMMQKNPEFRNIPHKDLLWAIEQNPSVLKLFLHCWICAPKNDGRWMILNHSLSSKVFRKASLILLEKRLFAIKRIVYKRNHTDYWVVANPTGANLSDDEIERRIINFIEPNCPAYEQFDECYGDEAYWNKELLMWEGESGYELNQHDRFKTAK